MLLFPHDYIEQWLQLDEMLARQGAKVDKVLNFAIDDAILEERITGRWIHPSSGRSYHTKFAPPKTPGVDDVSQIQNTWSCLHMSNLHDSGLDNYHLFDQCIVLSSSVSFLACHSLSLPLSQL